MKKKTAKAAPKADVLGARQDDVSRIRECLDKLGWTQARLAHEAALSLIMVNSFLNGRKKLSLAASDRVMTVINAGFDEKKKAAVPTSPEDADRLVEQVTNAVTDDEIQTQYGALAELGALYDLQNAGWDTNGLLSAREARAALSGPPRDPVAYEAWRAEQIKLHVAARELPIAKAWIKHQDKRVAELMKEVSALQERIADLEKINSLSREARSLYAGLVARLKQQLVDAGLTPVE